MSASSLPRIRATRAGSFNPIRPANVARTTLCGFAEPSYLVSTFWMPHDSTTARTAPPAIRPVPSGAGLSSTLPEPNLPTTWCGIVAPLPSGTRIRFFFAASMPFLMADGTSFALPMPKPTTPWPSPTTTSALKLRFLPPLTTFVTRLIETTVSLISSCEGSTFSRVLFISATSELQTGFSCRVSHCFHTAVIKKSVAIEDDALDALFDQPLGDGLADGLRALDVSAAGLLRQRALHRRLDGRRRRDRLAAGIVYDLHIHVRDASEDRQAWTLHCAAHAAADAVPDALAAIVFGFDPHYFAPVLPTFFFSCSPV